MTVSAPAKGPGLRATVVGIAALALLLAAGTPGASAATLTSFSAGAPTQLAGAAETWTIQFTTATLVPAGGDVRIVFPSGFQTSSGGVTVCALAGKTGIVTTVVSATEVVCELGITNSLAASEAVTATLTNVRSPTTAQTTGAFTVQTRSALDAVIDTHTTNTESIVANALTSLTASAPTQLTGAVETWTFGFTATNAVAASGDIRIVFPTGFTTSSGAASVCDVTAPLTVVGETTTVASATELLCNLGGVDSIAGGSAVSLTITNVKAPSAQQTTGAFTIQTRNSADAVHDQHLTNTEAIAPSLLTSVSVSAPLQRSGLTETWTVGGTALNAVAANGDIRIVFPAGFQTSNGAATVCDVAGKTGESATVVSATEVVCELNAATLAASEAFTLTLTNIRNPLTVQTTAAFTLQVRDAANAVQDHHLTNTEAIVSNTLTGVTVSAPLQTTGAVETWTVAATTASPVAANGDIRIVFPAGFQTSSGSATVCDVAGKTGESTTVVGATEVICNLNTATLAGSESFSLTLTNIKAPGTVQTTGAFQIITRDASDLVHDDHLTNTEAIAVSTLASLAVSAPQQTASAVETWTVAFTTINAVAANGDIRIVFPAGFQTSSGAATVCDVAGKTGESTTVVSATEIVCNLNAATLGASEAVSLTLTNVKNPTTAQTSGAFTIQTRDAADSLHDQHAANTETILGAALGSLSASAPLQTAGLVETWTFAFTTVNAIPANGDIRIVFPSGYASSSGATTVCDIAGKTAETTTVVSATEILCNLNAATASAGESLTITLTFVKNPTVSGSTAAFTVQTRDASDVVLDQHATNTESIAAGTLASVSMSAPLQRIGATETWTLSFVTANPVAANGDIRLLFPAGFVLSQGSASVCDVAGKTGETTVISGSVELRCELGASASLAAGESVSLTITNVGNPTPAQTTGVFTLQTRSSTDAVHDQHLTNTETLAQATLSGVSLSAPLQSVGATETWTLSFASAGVTTGGDIRIVFPNGFLLSSGAATVCDVAGKTGETTAVLTATEVVCSLNGNSLAASEVVTLSLTNVRNPLAAQTTGAFSIYLRDAGDTALEQHLSGTETIVAHSFTALSRSATTLNASLPASHTFTATLFNAWPAAGKLKVEFPAGFAFNEGGSTAVTAASFSASGGGAFAAPTASGTTLTLSRTGGSELPAGTIVTITLSNIRNPAANGVTGTFRLATIDGAGAELDAGTTSGVTIAGAAAPVMPPTDPVLPTPTPDPAVSDVPDSNSTAGPSDGPIPVRVPGFGPVAVAAGLAVVVLWYRRRA